MDKNSGRFIAITLTDAEWHALRAAAPDPVAWIRTQIDQLLDESGHALRLEPAEVRHEARHTVELAE